MPDTNVPEKPTSRPRLSLRTRVALLFALLGFVVSACLALVAVHFSDSYVHRLIDEMLRVEADYLSGRYEIDGRMPRPRSRHFYAFVTGGEERNSPPEEFIGLDPGLHEIEDAQGERHIAVYPVGKETMYVVLDVGLESTRERRLARDLFALVVFGTVLSAWLGWFWAGRAIEPVRRLARDVERLQPSRDGVARLAPEFAFDEVGALAQSFDRYQEKLYDFVRRERAFTADASHELRTPLAVIRGAIEVLLDNLLDALLVLARSDEREVDDGRTPDLCAVVDSLLRERSDALREKQLIVAREGVPDIEIAAPQKVLSVVIGNLLRATTQFAEGGTLRIDIAPHQVTIAHESDSDASSKIGEVATGKIATDARDYSLGLGMIRRVCERWGWALDEALSDSGSRAFVLRFG